jgi:hypothetical protein
MRSMPWTAANHEKEDDTSVTFSYPLRYSG